MQFLSISCRRAYKAPPTATCSNIRHQRRRRRTNTSLKGTKKGKEQMKEWNHRFGIRLITLLATLFWSGSAIAVDSYLTSFQNQYPTSTTGTTAWSSSSGRCNVCHSSGGGTPLNSYGAAWAIRLNAGRTVTQAFIDIEGDNSDGSSVNNISEITANAQPGWSPGATNTLYDLFSPGTAILFNQDPPTSLVGDVDPAATPTPTTPTPSPTPTPQPRPRSSSATSRPGWMWRRATMCSSAVSS